jgi:hypothetical protein
MPLRTLIAGKLEKSGVLPLQTAKIRGFIPVGRSDLASMYDESACLRSRHSRSLR